MKAQLNPMSYEPPLENRRGKLRLDFNENLIGVSPKVLHAIQSVKPEDISIYPSYKTTIDKISESFGISPANVVLTAGIDEGLKLVIESYMSVNEKALILTPSFSMYEFYLRIANSRILRVPYNEDFSFPRKEILEVIKKEKPKLVLIADPNNPTGTEIDDKRQFLEKVARENLKTLFVIDEAYGEFGSESAIPLIGEIKNLVVLRTFSKAYGLAGLRVGFIATNAENANFLRKVTSPYAVNYLACIAVQAVLEDRGFIEGYVKNVKVTREWLRKEMLNRGYFVPPSKANFLMIDFGLINDWVVRKLSKAGILIRNRSNQVKNYSRVTVGVKWQAMHFLDALDKIMAEPALLFDMDGVLVDVTSSYRETIKYVVKEMTGKIISNIDIERVKQIEGYNNDWNVTYYFIRKTNPEITFEEVKRRFQVAFLENPNFSVREKWIMDKDLLKMLNEEYRLAIVTGRPKSEAFMTLEKEKTIDLFHAVICMEDVENDKPDPQGIFLALKELKAKSGKYFGDTPNDIQAARRAGMEPIGVATTGSSHKKFRELGVENIIEDINDIMEVL